MIEIGFTLVANKIVPGLGSLMMIWRLKEDLVGVFFQLLAGKLLR